MMKYPEASLFGRIPQPNYHIRTSNAWPVFDPKLQHYPESSYFANNFDPRRQYYNNSRLNAINLINAQESYDEGNRGVDINVKSVGDKKWTDAQIELGKSLFAKLKQYSKEITDSQSSVLLEIVKKLPIGDKQEEKMADEYDTSIIGDDEKLKLLAYIFKLYSNGGVLENPHTGVKYAIATVYNYIYTPHKSYTIDLVNNTLVAGDELTVAPPTSSVPETTPVKTRASASAPTTRNRRRRSRKPKKTPTTSGSGIPELLRLIQKIKK